MIRLKLSRPITTALYVAASGAYLADAVFDLGHKLDAPPNAAVVLSSSASDTGQVAVKFNTITDAEYPVVRPPPPIASARDT